MSEYVEVAIPDWIGYVVMNNAGTWVGFKSEPHPNEILGVWEGMYEKAIPLGRFPDRSVDWRKTKFPASDSFMFTGGEYHIHFVKEFKQKDNTPKTANEILHSMQGTLADRAKVRDSEEGERSFEKARDGWWAIFGDNILERGYPLESEICYFMTVLKWVRSLNGEYRYDDHHDAANYCVLGVEAAERENNERPRS